MNEKDVLENSDFESYWLTHANADLVFQWLKERKPSFNRFAVATNEKTLVMREKTLVMRREPLIRLGLALYCKLSSETALNLYRKSDSTIKCALLAGPSVNERGARYNVPRDFWLYGGGVLEDILSSIDENFTIVDVLFSNEFIAHETIFKLYEKQSPFHELSDKHWLWAIDSTTQNPTIEDAYSEAYSPYYDEQGPLDTGVLRHSAWNLFATVPVDDFTAEILARVGKILTPYGERPYGERWPPSVKEGFDVRETIKRWEKSEDHDNFETAFEKFLFRFDRKPYRACRAALGRLLEDDELKESNDVALRQAYYNRLDWHRQTPNQVQESFEKDREDFLDVALENHLFYVDESVRLALWDCCARYDSDNNNPFRSTPRYEKDFVIHAKKWAQMYPKWFAKKGDDRHIDRIEDRHQRMEERLVFVQQEIKEIKTLNSELKPEILDGLLDIHKISVGIIKSKLSYVAVGIIVALALAVIIISIVD